MTLVWNANRLEMYPDSKWLWHPFFRSAPFGLLLSSRPSISAGFGMQPPEKGQKLKIVGYLFSFLTALFIYAIGSAVADNVCRSRLGY